jgi:hypothetical protein
VESEFERPVGREGYRGRLDELSAILESIMETFEDLRTKRCPYRDKHDRCTAKFVCRNRHEPPVEGERMFCGVDEQID